MDHGIVGLRLLIRQDVVGVVDLEIVDVGAAGGPVWIGHAVGAWGDDDIARDANTLRVNNMTCRQDFIGGNQHARPLPVLAADDIRNAHDSIVRIG